MNRENAEKLVTKTFNFPFNEDKYSELISNIFKKSIGSEIKDNFVEIPDYYKDKVDNIKTYASFYDDTNKKIEAIEVILKEKTSLEKSRYIQRDIATWYLTKTNKEAILCAFHSYEKNPDWRFSYVEREKKVFYDQRGNLRVKINLTPVKRFSFLVGKNEPNFTAKSQVIPLLENSKNSINDIKNVFSIEPVTIQFFRDFKNLYTELLSDLKNLIKKDKKIFNDFKNKNIILENFAKKTLGQIVFLFFLQKKGWLGIKKNENGNFQKWGSGSKSFLQQLFLSYKNKKFKSVNFFNNILEPLFYEALNNEEDYYSFLDCKIPFLNGGLFEPYKDYNWTETDIYIDDNLIQKILTTFQSYNFTVQEDQTLDTDIAVDPEMLGKVFENLLPENFKREQGLFYTPRDIVQFMCRESLIGFILKQNENIITRENIENLISISENISDSEIKNLIEKYQSFKNQLIKIENDLKNIKICDPAIGSGAFPVILMIEIVNLRKTINQILEKKVFIYDLKRYFIENNLYGVDIDISAIELAKLRLWLSLVIEEESFEKIKPLPNLDYKLIQGNSVVERIGNINFEKESNDLFGDLISKDIKVELRKLQSNYFNSTSKRNKKIFKEKINLYFNNIIFEHLKEKVNSNKNLEKHNILKFNKSDTQLGNKDFFLWKVFFYDVFDVKKGFDIIISNPPYIKEYSNKDAFAELKDHKYYKGKMDIWYFFFCKFIDLLNDKGIITFIAENNWYTNFGASILRNKIIKDSNIEIIKDFGNLKVFENASIQTMILMCSKNNTRQKYKFLFSKLNKEKISKKELINFLNNNNIEENNLFVSNLINFEKRNYENKTFSFYGDKDNQIINKISNKRNFLLKDSDITNGIHPHHAKVNKKIHKILSGKKIKSEIGDGIFVINSSELRKTKLNKNEKEIVKPVYFSENLKKYFTNKSEENYIFYTSNEFNNEKIIKKYPNVRKHLDKYKDIITSDFRPYGLHRKRNEHFFIGEKINSLRKCIEPKFTYTDFDCYVLADHYIIKTDRIKLTYLTLFLNSKIIKFWFLKEGKTQGNNFQIDKEPLLKLPIHYPKNIEFFIKKFKEIKILIKNKRSIDKLVNEIDNKFYKIFDLNEQQIKRVENILK